MEPAFKNKYPKGSVLGVAFLCVLIPLGFITALVLMQKSNAQQVNSQINRDRLHQTAYESQVEALAKISANSGLTTLGLVSGHGPYADYSVKIMPITATIGTLKDVSALENSVFLVITTTLTTPVSSPAPHHLTAYAIITVANAGKYFAASRQSWGVGERFNAPDADIYGRDVVIYSNAVGPLISKSRKIFYFRQATSLDMSQPSPNAPINEVHGVMSNRYVTTEGALTNQGTVNQLSAEPIFPQLSPANMAEYKTLAQSGSSNNSFFLGDSVFPDDIIARGWATNTEIYPPGCASAACGNLSNADLKNHIYFVQGNLRIRGKVFGQVLFVATGLITVDGDLISDRLAGDPAATLPPRDLDHPDNPYPGCGSTCKEDKNLNSNPNASNAHQTVLVTPSILGVKYDNNATAANIDLYTDIGDPADVLSVEAFIVVPYGSIGVTDPTGPVRGFYFRGSMIVGLAPDLKTRLTSIRPITYMNTLATRPPPFVPGFTQLLIWHEEYH